MTIALDMPSARTDRAVPAILVAIVALGAVAALGVRLYHGIGVPLWLDETWTAIISNRPTFAAFWREAWLDCNPPLYYLVMHLWQGLAGQSDWAMRAPSMAFVAAAAALPLLWRAPGLSTMAAVTWAGLIWFWWPGLSVTLDARAYSLLLLICTGQAIAFAGLIEKPTLRRAMIWCALSSLAILTHYYAVYLGAVQGLMYLALHRERAVKTWPAALLFLPAFGWMFAHLPRIAEYGRPDVAWYPHMGALDVLSCFLFLTGPSTLMFAASILMVLAGGYLAGSRFGPAEPDEEAAPRHLWWAASTGVIAFAVCTAVALVKPSLTERYVTAMVPVTLLLLVTAASLSRRAHLTYVMLAALFLAAVLTPNQLDGRLRARSLYGFQREAEFLMQAKPTQVIFSWDHPATKILDKGSLAELGGFFFKRAGMNPETVPIVLAPGEDPNRRMLAEADGDRPVLLWLYNKDRKSAARDFPPNIEALDSSWTCLQNRNGARGVVACAPKRLFAP